MILLREKPSFVRPTKMCPDSRGTATMTPVSRTRKSFVAAASYMIPLLHVTRRSAPKLPLNMNRASRICALGNSANCSLLAASCEYAAYSYRNPAPTRAEAESPSNSFHLTSLRAGTESSSSPASRVSSSVSGSAAAGVLCDPLAWPLFDAGCWQFTVDCMQNSITSTDAPAAGAPVIGACLGLRASVHLVPLLHSGASRPAATRRAAGRSGAIASICVEQVLQLLRGAFAEQRQCQENPCLLWIQLVGRDETEFVVVQLDVASDRPGHHARAPHHDDAFLHGVGRRSHRRLVHVPVADARDHDALRAIRRRAIDQVRRHVSRAVDDVYSRQGRHAGDVELGLRRVLPFRAREVVVLPVVRRPDKPAQRRHERLDRRGARLGQRMSTLNPVVHDHSTPRPAALGS